MKIEEFVKKQNKKITFCPGPGSLTKENIRGLSNCFGRGDEEYKSIEKKVFRKIKNISGQKKIVTFQGSGSLAIEMMFVNFLYGNILIVSTGYYSDRLISISKKIKKSLNPKIKKINEVSYKDINKKFKGRYDWVIACPTETSIGLLLPIKEISNFTKKLKAKLMLDATGSIGLEKNHNLANVISFSSCKGLFGLTGASFIAFKDKPKNKVESFYLDINTHLNKGVTGPYHTILSMNKVLENYNDFKQSVIINKKIFLKKMKGFLIHGKKNQPLLCTYVKKKIYSNSKNIILYSPRSNPENGSVVCHLGELNLKKNSKGKILQILRSN